LTTGRNVVSWICRHSQEEDRHHAQPRTSDLDTGKRRPEFRSPRYSALAQWSARLPGPTRGTTTARKVKKARNLGLPPRAARRRGQTIPMIPTPYESIACSMVQCVVRCAVEGSAHAEQPGICNSSPSGAALRDAGVRCRAESHDQRPPVRRLAASPKGCAPAQPAAQSDYRQKGSGQMGSGNSGNPSDACSTDVSAALSPAVRT
jgi:hypothetical protein